VDAWAIWDPFLAAVENQTGARIVADGRGVVNNFAYYLAERGYAQKFPQVIQALFEDTVIQGQWLKANIKQAAAIIAPQQGLAPEVVEKSLTRYQFGVKPLTPAVAAEQQKVADTFHTLQLIPKPIRIVDALPGVLQTAQSK
jgi:sulfonate transport system substrate-binding protein